LYQITEIKTEPGNALLKEPIMVTLPMTMTEDEANEYGNVDFTSAKEDVNYSCKWYFYECLYEITNNATFKMPMTGDDGKWKYGFIGLGIVMTISAGFVICSTKNKKVKKRKHRK
jgi:LPXTG-motif cell wall-anchored protein